MMFKVVMLFLLAMVVIAMVGNILYPGALGRQVKRRLIPGSTGPCSRCGRPMVGRTCDCRKKG
jgi:hypothetical protein